jgi:hypothetical protein
MTKDMPNKKDILFRGDLPDWHNNACLKVRRDNDEPAYIEGYRRGARYLVQLVNENARDQDYLVYPIVFLYRHHIELILKTIIYTALDILREAPTKEIKKRLETGHHLDDLWSDAKLLLSRVNYLAGWEDISIDTIEGIDSHIRQLTDIDEKSFTFRYARSKAGASKPVNHINLRHFSETIEKSCGHLETIDMALGHLLEESLEYQADMMG